MIPMQTQVLTQVQLYKCDTRSGKGGSVSIQFQTTQDGRLVDAESASADVYAAYLSTLLLKMARLIGTPSIHNTEDVRENMVRSLLQRLQNMDVAPEEFTHPRWMVARNAKKALLGIGAIEVVEPRARVIPTPVDREGGRSMVIFLRFQFERTKHWYGAVLSLAPHRKDDRVLTLLELSVLLCGTESMAEILNRALASTEKSDDKK